MEVMFKKSVKIFVAILSVLLSTHACASEMAGVGLALSIPFSVLLVIIAFVLATMASTRTGYNYVIGIACVAGVIALFMASHDWQLESDITMYRWHLLLTLVSFFPVIIFKLRMRRNLNANTKFWRYA